MNSVKILNPRDGGAACTSISRARRYVKRGSAVYENNKTAIRFIPQEKRVRYYRAESLLLKARNEAETLLRNSRLKATETGFENILRTMSAREISGIPFTGDPYKLLQLRTRRNP